MSVYGHCQRLGYDEVVRWTPSQTSKEGYTLIDTWTYSRFFARACVETANVEWFSS